MIGLVAFNISAFCAAGQRAPRSLYLGVANSGRRKRRQAKELHSCHVTLFAPFWVANSSMCALKVWDRPADSQRLGLPEVLEHSAMVVPRGVYGAHGTAAVRCLHTGAHYRPALG
jgi:hypothetical protein